MQNITNFLASDASILKTYKDENKHTYARNEEPKKKVLLINSQNKDQEIAMQLTFALKINLQKFILE